jgi:hypothetical protein
LASLALSKEQRTRRNQLVQSWVDGKAPGSHAAELKSFLGAK